MGTRCRHWPTVEPGLGTSRPIVSAVAAQDSIAPSTLSIASVIVSPSDMQPGRSGTVATYPPPSCSGSGRTRTAYLLAIVILQNAVDKTDQSSDIEGFDRPVGGYGQYPLLTLVRNGVVVSSCRCCTCDSYVLAYRDHVTDLPVIPWIPAHSVKALKRPYSYIDDTVYGIIYKNVKGRANNYSVVGCLGVKV